MLSHNYSTPITNTRGQLGHHYLSVSLGGSMSTVNSKILLQITVSVKLGS